jgi:hypothetical protein
MARTGPAPSLELLDYRPPDDRWRYLIIRRLVDRGCPITRAWAILEAIDRLAETGDDGLISPTRSLYRRELHKLGAPPWSGGDRSEYMGALISSISRRKQRKPHGGNRDPGLWRQGPRAARAA